jgi:hypothetical protein
MIYIHITQFVTKKKTEITIGDITKKDVIYLPETEVIIRAN